MALFLLKTAEGREDVAFWLLDALATTVIPGHWEKLDYISTIAVGVVTIRCCIALMSSEKTRAHSKTGAIVRITECPTG